MRIALVNTFMPYIYGGAEIVANNLDKQLRENGHEVVLFRILFPRSYDAQIITTIESSRLFCFDEFDRVIAFKFPTYCIQHHSKVIWLAHQFRQVYDLWGKENGLKPNPLNEYMRIIIKSIDNVEIPRSRHIYTNGKETSNRLKQYNNIDSIVLNPPLQNYENYYFERTGDYLFYPSRITSIKRQLLAIEAMQYTKSNVHLIIAGVCEENGYLNKIKKFIMEKKLEKRVQIRSEWISENEKISLFANSLGVIFIPFKEDFGLVTMEAFYSKKPIITCNDSGGPCEFVENKKNGFIIEPIPQVIAKAMDELYDNKILAEQMGQNGFDEIIRRDITWPSTIKRLLS